MSDRIELVTEIDAPINVVWHVLTSAEYVAGWYAFDGAEIDLRLGGQMTFHWNEHGTFRARIERLHPPRLLEFRYASLEADTDPHLGNSTYVAFSLTARADVTTITLVETGHAHLIGSPEELASHVAVSEVAWRNALELLRDRAVLVYEQGSLRGDR